MKTYNCLLVEDEPLAQRVIQKHIAQYKELQLVATVENALRAIEIINKTKVDLIFLDITLPVMSGIDFVKLLKNPPLLVFTTAYSEFAVTSYDLDAVDYLLKPITFDRFTQAITRFLRVAETAANKEAFLFIKEGGKLTKVCLDEITYIEARKDYLLVSTPQRRLLTYSTMKAMEEQLPPDQFMRIHRSYIVSRKFIKSISSFTVEVAGTLLPIGEKYKPNLRQEFRKRT
jgi:DNA-binding LytR/AlgR family response regulator